MGTATGRIAIGAASGIWVTRRGTVAARRATLLSGVGAGTSSVIGSFCRAALTALIQFLHGNPEVSAYLIIVGRTRKIVSRASHREIRLESGTHLTTADEHIQEF